MKIRFTIKKILTLVALLLIIVAVVGFVFINHLAKAGIEVGGKAALGVPTRVDGVHVGLFSGSAELSKLNVGNPEGFTSPSFLTLNSGAVAVSLPSLLGDVVEIPTLELDGVDLYVEKNKEGRANYQVIMDHQKKRETDEPAKTKADKSDESGKKLIIKQVKITNVTMHADVLPAGPPVLVVVPEILLTNVGTSDGAGVNTAEVVNILVKAIFASAVANSANLLPADVLADMNAGLDKLTSVANQYGVQVAGQALENVTKTLNTQREKLENATGGVSEKATEGLNKGLDNLLKKGQK